VLAEGRQFCDALLKGGLLEDPSVVRIEIVGDYNVSGFMVARVDVLLDMEKMRKAMVQIIEGGRCGDINHGVKKSGASDSA
jgi:hypothetical protein